MPILHPYFLSYRSYYIKTVRQQKVMVAMYQSYFRSNLDFNFLLIGSIFIISFFYFVFFFLAVIIHQKGFLCLSKRVAQCLFIGFRPKLQRVCDQVFLKNPLSIAKPYEIIDQKSFPILQGLWYHSWAKNDCQSNKTTTVVRERLKAAAGLYTFNLKIFL